jgi:hypothetical protein
MGLTIGAMVSRTMKIWAEVTQLNYLSSHFSLSHYPSPYEPGYHI